MIYCRFDIIWRHYICFGDIMRQDHRMFPKEKIQYAVLFLLPRRSQLIYPVPQVVSVGAPHFVPAFCQLKYASETLGMRLGFSLFEIVKPLTEGNVPVIVPKSTHLSWWHVSTAIYNNNVISAQVKQFLPTNNR